MSQPNIDPQRVTKPIQLLAAWLVGLILVNGSLLAAAIQIGDKWERSVLIVAAILNVPAFITAIFLLQTKFRPELQEDIFYSTYISRKTSGTVEINKIDLIDKRLADLSFKIEQSAFDPDAAARSFDAAVILPKNYKVALNTNINFYKELQSSLMKANIPVATLFGSTATVPLEQIIAYFSEDIDFKYVLKLLKIIIAFPIKGFAFWEPVRDAGEAEDVYIGGYGRLDGVIFLNEELRSRIEAAQDRSDFNKILVQ